MPKGKGKQLTFDDCCEIEEMLKAVESFRAIAHKLGVSPTTVSNEVKSNRTLFTTKKTPTAAQARCSGYAGCRIVSLCAACKSGASSCKRCKLKRCYDICKELDKRFQVYVLLPAKTQAHVKAALDAVEAYCPRRSHS